MTAPSFCTYPSTRAKEPSMLLVYTPEDGPRREFPFQLLRLMSPEAEALEDIGGNAWDTFEEFGDKLTSGGIRARRALLWIMLRRENPKLRFSDLVVRVDELSFASEEEDREVARKLLAERSDLSPEDREQLEALIEEDDAATIVSLSSLQTEPDPGKGEDDAESTDSP